MLHQPFFQRLSLFNSATLLSLLLRAVANPCTTILGHMTGRQLQRRPDYEIHVEKVLRACAKHDVAVEINAHPRRLHWHQPRSSSAA